MSGGVRVRGGCTQMHVFSARTNRFCFVRVHYSSIQLILEVRIVIELC